MTRYPAWPLHPPPTSFETLRSYVRRLSKLYDVTSDTFCRNALGIPLTDREGLLLTNPSDDVIARLSAGVGVPVEDLHALRPEVAYARLSTEIDAFLATPEGKQHYESMFGPLSQQMGTP